MLSKKKLSIASEISKEETDTLDILKYILIFFRGSAKGIDNNIFPRRMEIDWVHYYQRR
jgi:hypothetical protein